MDWRRARVRGRRTRAGYQPAILPDPARISHTGPPPVTRAAAEVTESTVAGRLRRARDQRTGGRSQPGGSSSGTSQSDGGVKSHQVPSNGNSPASASAITRFPSARTASGSGTQ